MREINKPRDIEAWLSELGLPTADRDYKPGHERVLALMSALEKEGYLFHQPKLRVRVAGTNGKGSTSQFLAAALQACGLKVGLYTSPHICTFYERIRIQGEMIDQHDMLTLMEAVMPLALATQTSYFETATVVALLHFSMQQVDVEILEAGVGAKLDATTAVPADMGLLTPIALDHQDWLGDSLAKIARDKAYVFAGCKHAISAAQDSEVKQQLNQLDLDIQYAGMFDLPLSTLGSHQRQNAGLAWQALNCLKRDQVDLSDSIDLAVCAEAISSLSIPGRMQHIQCEKHHFWLDAAHNEHAVNEICHALEKFDHKFDVVILATREDRDLSMCVSQLKTFAKEVVVMTGEHQAAYSCVADALEAEVSKVVEGHFLVLGSFITLGETLKWLANTEKPALMIKNEI
ncbi:MAG: Mur ligase family protein [Ghiorsea sp.]